MKNRFIVELRSKPKAEEVDAALGSLVAAVADDTVAITRGGAGAPLLAFAAPAQPLVRVRIAPDVYEETPTTAARVRLLGAASALAPIIEVHAPTTTAGTHRGRLAFDLPRRLLRAVGIDSAEPGDRFDRRFKHAFFDDEAIVEEAARAGLAFVARHGAWVVLDRRAERAASHADPFAREVIRAIGLARKAERLRLHANPEQAVRTMRERGRHAQRRDVVGRARLRRAIGWIDTIFPRGPNCFRRTLVELGLDAGAADETLVFGLDVGRTGHVAFKDSEDQRFDVVFEIPSDSKTSRTDAEGR